MKKNYYQKAFTLPELLVTMAILVIVMGAVYLAYSLNQKAYREGEDTAEITQNGRVIVERFNREIRQAKEIVGSFPESEEEATSTITFEDGHIADPYHYIHYFKTDDTVKREVLGYYFSGDSEETLVPWNAVPPDGQTLETKTLEATKIIGEWVSGLGLWGSEIINIALTLEKSDKTLYLETKIFGRNL
jgi:prepilin-type N-terminal cleavage/methylation domain-containing protein